MTTSTSDLWLLRYTATADLKVSANHKLLHLIPNLCLELHESDALHLLAHLQRTGRPQALTILHRPMLKETKWTA